MNYKLKNSLIAPFLFLLYGVFFCDIVLSASGKATVAYISPANWTIDFVSGTSTLINPAQLFEINLKTNSASSVATLGGGNITGLTYDAAGNLYYSLWDVNKNLTLTKIDVKTHGSSPVGNGNIITAAQYTSNSAPLGYDATRNIIA